MSLDCPNERMIKKNLPSGDTIPESVEAYSGSSPLSIGMDLFSSVENLHIQGSLVPLVIRTARSSGKKDTEPPRPYAGPLVFCTCRPVDVSKSRMLPSILADTSRLELDEIEIEVIFLSCPVKWRIILRLEISHILIELSDPAAANKLPSRENAIIAIVLK